MNKASIFDHSSTSCQEARLLLSIVLSIVIHASVVYLSKDFQPRVPAALTEVKRMALNFASLNPVTATIVGSTYQATAIVKNVAINEPEPFVKTTTIKPQKRLTKIVPKKLTQVIEHKNTIQKIAIKPSLSATVIPADQIPEQLQQARNDVIEIEIKSNSSKMSIEAGVVNALQASEKQLAVRLNPKFRSSPLPPVYPRQSIRRHQQGTTLIRAKISRLGHVETLTVHQTSNFEALDQAAIAAVQKWQFEPAKSNGFNIASWVQVPVNFVLK